MSLADQLSEQAIADVLGAIPAHVALPRMARVIARMWGEKQGFDNAAGLFGSISRECHLEGRRRCAAGSKGRR